MPWRWLRGSQGRSIQMGKKANNGPQYVYEYADDASYYGGNDNDYFDIAGDRNLLSGDNGMDTLVAYGQENTLSGGNGDDILAAFSEQRDPPTHNVIEAGRGDDVIYTFGVFGHDTMGIGALITGGSGLDTFVLAQNSDVLASNSEADTRGYLAEGDTVQGVFDVITDYQAGERIEIGVSMLRTDPIALYNWEPGHNHLLLNDNEYAFIRGDWNGGGSFVVNDDGGDLMIVFDNDPYNEYFYEYNGSVILAGVTDPALVNVGG